MEPSEGGVKKGQSEPTSKRQLDFGGSSAPVVVSEQSETLTVGSQLKPLVQPGPVMQQKAVLVQPVMQQKAALVQPPLHMPAQASHPPARPL